MHHSRTAHHCRPRPFAQPDRPGPPRWVAAARGVVALGLFLAAGLAGCRPEGLDQTADHVRTAWGRAGRGDGEFIYPRAIARTGNGCFWVVDKTARIQRFDNAGRFEFGFRMPELRAGKPTGLTVAPDQRLYVADTHYHRVLVFTPDGAQAAAFGAFGSGPGQFIYPTDVAFAPDSRIFVSEYGGNDRVNIFSGDHRFLASFGTRGPDPGQFARPSALCVDADRQRLYVADACNHRIAVYDLNGRLETYWASAGDAPGQVRFPYDLALLADGSLVVCEFGNNRIQVFDAQGRSRGAYGHAGRALGALAFPWGVVIDDRDRAVIVDAGNDRIQVWQL